jgi:streptogramin lyase
VQRLGIVVVALVVIGVGCAKRAPDANGPRLPALSELREFVIPWGDAFPNDVGVDSLGRVWFTDRLTHAIGMFDPATEEFRRYPTPTPRTAPYGMLVAPDGSIWYAGSRVGLLGRVDPATGSIAEFNLENAEGGPQLLVWHEGEVWFTLRERRSYGRFHPGTGATTIYQLQHDRPYSIVTTPHGLWMSSYGANRLVQVNAETGAATIHDLSTAAYDNGSEAGADTVRRARGQRILPGQPHRLATDTAGGLWASDFTRSRIIRYDAGAGLVRGWESVEQLTEPYGVAVTSRGLVVYAERSANRVVVLDPRSDSRLRVPVLTPGGAIRNIAIDEMRGRIWLPMSDTGRLGLLEMR